MIDSLYRSLWQKKMAVMISLSLLCLFSGMVNSQDTKSDSNLNVLELLKLAASGDLNSVKKNLEPGMNINAADPVFYATALHNAASQGHVHVVDWLIDSDADIEQKDSQGATALIWSAYSGQSGTLTSLLNAGAYPNHVPQQGPTALIAAIQSGDLNAVNVLLEYGAQSSLASTDGMMPIDAAKLRNDQSIITLLNNSGDKK